MSDLFISYSRKDEAFVRRLHRALQSDNRDAWVDWEGIPPTVQWMAEITAAIVSANAFLFVISPDSVQSEVCGIELAHAVENNKRLIPIICREVDPKMVPPDLRELNWISFLDERNFDSAFQSLSSALDTDIDWVREHTRLLVRAAEWNSNDRRQSLTLRGKDLQAATAWLARTDKSPPASRLHKDYIHASQKAARLRNQAMFAAGVAVVILVVFGLVQFFGRQSEQLRAEAEAAGRIEQQELAEAFSQEASNQTTIATARQLAIQAEGEITNNYSLALLLSLEAVGMHDSPETRASLLSGLQHSQYLQTFLYGHEGEVIAVDFSPDENVLASAGSDGLVIIWDTQTLQEKAQMTTGHTGSVEDVRFSPDGTLLATAGEDGKVILWDAESFERIGSPLTGHTDTITVLDFSADGRFMASGSWDGTVIVWDLATLKPVGPPLQPEMGSIWSVAFNPADGTLAGGGDFGTVLLWNPETLSRVGEPYTGAEGQVRGIAFSPDGQVMATASTLGVVLWDMETHTRLGDPIEHEDSLYSVTFSPSGYTIFTTDRSRAINLWDAEYRDRPVPAQIVHADRVTDVAVSSKHGVVAAASHDGSISIWNFLAGPSLVREARGHRHFIWSLDYSPDGSMMASGSEDGELALWSMVEGQPTGRTVLSSDTSDDLSAARSIRMWSVAFSPDSRLLAAGDAVGALTLWDVSSVPPAQVWSSDAQHSLTDMAFSPDGQTLLIPDFNDSVEVWDVVNGDLLHQFETSTEITITVAFSPDGTLIASGARSGEVVLLDVETGQELAKVDGHGRFAVFDVAFSPDGSTLASGGEDNTIVLWKVPSLEPIGEPLLDHTDTVNKIAFSPDGFYLASASSDASVRLWDVVAQQQVGVFDALQNTEAIAFAPDGKSVVSGGFDRALRIWNLSLESWQEQACIKAGRNLAQGEWDLYLGNQPYRETCPAMLVLPDLVNVQPTPAPTQSPNPDMIIQPQIGLPGTSHLVNVAFLQPYEPVEIVVVYEPTQEIIWADNFTAGSDGVFTINLTSEEGDASGKYIVTVTGAAGSEATSWFEILEN